MNKEHNTINDLMKIIDTVYKILPSQNIPDIEIRPSSVHGLGLFANQPITKDTIITYYPINVIQINDAFSAENNNKLLIDRLRLDDSSVDRTYAYTCSSRFQPGYHVFIYGFPDIINDKKLLGHMINDGGNNVYDGVNIESLENIVKFKNKLAEYYINCNKRVNCKYNECNCTVQIIATRDINKDEEILTSYDASYWYSQTYNTVTKYDEKDKFDTKFEHLLKTDTNFRKFMNGMNFI